VGQGALGLETRIDDETTRSAVEKLNHVPSRWAVTAERVMLAELKGGCFAPIGALAHVEAETLHLQARVLSADGVEKVEAAMDSAPQEAETLGRRVAEALIQKGAAELIRAARERG